MTTTLTEPSDRTATPAAERLRRTMAAVRVSLSWFGTRKTLTREQKSEAADAFGAEGAFLSAGKKLVDTGHPRLQGCHLCPGQDPRPLEGVHPAVPGTSRETDPTRSHRGFQREDAGTPRGAR